MRGMIRKIVLFGVLAGACGVRAVPVTDEEAARAAGAWLRQRAQLGCALGATVASIDGYDAAGKRFYVAALTGGGFIVLSSDTESEPVIAFSAAQGFAPTAENPLLAMVTKGLAPRAGAPEKWAKLLAPTSGRRTLAATEGLAEVSDLRVAPLTETRWAQGLDTNYAEIGELCYNYYTPNHYSCGCVATAGAQIMRYHRFPVASVTPQTFACQVDGKDVHLTMQGGVYAWDKMTAVPFDGATEEERQAIGKLTSDVGIACNTSYRPHLGSTGPYMLAPALTDTFGYANAVAFVTNNCDAAFFKSVIIPNLDAHLPVFVSIRGEGNLSHAVVADGYGYSDETFYVHFNLGWAGMSDAWYAPPEIERYDSIDGFVCNIYPKGSAARVICSGRVTATSAEIPEAGVPVCAYAHGAAAAVSETETDAQGIYALLLPPGTYDIVADDGIEALTNKVTLVANVGTEVITSGPYMGMYYPNPITVGNLYGQDFNLTDAPGPLEPLTLTLDPVGGELTQGEETRTVYRGHHLGILPEPTREGFLFAGWYTEVDAGERVTADTRLEEETTLYAHWERCFDFPETLGAVDLGVAMTPLSIADFVNSNCLSAVVVSGLPKNLVYTPSSATISGTPATAGTYTLRFAVTLGGQTVEAVTALVVKDYPEVAVYVDEAAAAAGCRVTGAGAFKVGTKVTLKATLPKGWAFAGWSDEEGVLESLYAPSALQATTLAYVCRAENPVIRANFISAADDYCRIEGIFGGPNDVHVKIGESVSGTVTYKSGSAISALKVTGLPAGLKFDAKTFVVSGAPTKAGVFYVTANIKNANGYAQSRVFVMYVGDVAEVAFAEKLAIGEGYSENCVGVKSVSGLPTGLKYDAKTGLVSGVCTKAGVFAVKYTRATGAETRQMLVTDPGSRYVAATVVGGGGTVTGAGVYAVGATAKLSAKAEKGYVFAGWYADAALAEPAVGSVDYRTAAFARTVGEADNALYARFVTAAADLAQLQILTEAAYSTTKDGDFALTIPVASLSVPKLSVKGLPAGLKFDAKTNRISGTTRKPGVYTVAVSATNLSVKKAVVKEFVLTVPNIESPYLPGLDYATDAYPIAAGVSFGADVIDLATADGYLVTAMSGLPAGLKFDAKTRTLGGVPTKAGSFTVTITAKKGNVTTTATITLSVAALPAWAYGTFDGYSLGETLPDGLVTLTATAAGKVSGKLVRQGKTWALSAPSFSACDAPATPDDGVYFAELVGKCGKEVFTNELVICAESTEALDGFRRGRMEMAASERADVTFESWQNPWKAEPFKTRAKAFNGKTATLANGVVLKTAASGAVTAAGQFGGYKASASTVLVPLGEDMYQVSVVFAPVAGKFDGFASLVRLVWDATALQWRVAEEL